MSEHSANDSARQGHYPSGRGDRLRRSPVRDDIASLDRSLVKLLVKRNNMLARLRDAKGKINPAEEKQLRENWENAVARVSRDPLLSSRMFTILQNCTFLPRPAGPQEADATQLTGAERRTAFNLAPATKPVRLRLPAPLDSHATRAWMMLAAATGQALRIEPCLMNDDIVDCLKAINQLGEPGTVPPGLNREGDCISIHPAPPTGAPDKVLHIGGSAWNFYLLLGQYLGRPSRAKFTGSPELRLADFSAVRHFLPQLGARLVHLTPKSDGMPVRLECSGILPEAITVPADLPGGLVEGILLAAPQYQAGISINASGHPELDLICKRTLPILQAAGAQVSCNGSVFRITPGQLAMPARPVLAMDTELAGFLLALPLALGGEVELEGRWPDGNDTATALRDILRALGLRFSSEKEKQGIIAASAGQALASARLSSLDSKIWSILSGSQHLHQGPETWQALPLALAACAALRGGEVDLPQNLVESIANNAGIAAAFCHATGLEMVGNNLVLLQDAGDGENGEAPGQKDSDRPVWNAPDPLWAMALAIAACARPAGHQGFRLGNPGIVTELYPAFWGLYNSLPEPATSKGPVQQAPAQQQRRRIRTSVEAELPEPVDED